MRYRRARAAGGTYFFTLNLADRSSHLLVERVDELRAAVRLVKLRHPFEVVGWVVLPDHLHALWTLPADDADFSTVGAQQNLTHRAQRKLTHLYGLEV